MQPSDIRHFVVTKEAALGPLSTAQVLNLFEESPELLHSVQWISPELQSPLLSLEWFAEFASDADFEKILARAVPNPSVRPVEGATQQASHSASSDSVPNCQVKPSNYLNPPKSKWRELLALFGLGALGFALFVVGGRSLKPQRTTVRSDVPFPAKVMSSTPDAVRAYQMLLEAKILRDGKKFSSALLAIQKDRSLYPEGYLPSAEHTASLALAHMTHSELDQRSDWKQLLTTLSPESRQKGLAVVAYEFSRLAQARRDLLASSGKSKQKQIKAAVEEVGISLERLIRIVPGFQPPDRALHALFLARTMTFALVTLSEHPQVAKQNAEMAALLEKMTQLDPALAEVDRELISILLPAVKQRMKSPEKPADWATVLGQVRELHESTRFLCQLNNSGAATDLLLHAVSQAAAAKQKMPALPKLFDGCFVGLQTSPKAAGRFSTDEADPIVEFVSAGPADESLLRDFRKQFPTMNPALQRIAGGNNAAGDWLLLMHFNGVVKGRLVGGSKPGDRKKLCGKANAESNICLQAVWSEMRGVWRDSLPLLAEFQENASPGDLNALVQRFVLDASRDILQGQSKQKAKEIVELFSVMKSFGASEDPQLQFILDYAKTFEGES